MFTIEFLRLLCLYCVCFLFLINEIEIIELTLLSNTFSLGNFLIFQRILTTIIIDQLGEVNLK